MTRKQREEAAKFRAIWRDITGCRMVPIVSLPERRHDAYDAAVRRYGEGGEATRLRRELLKLGVLPDQIAWHFANRGAEPLSVHSI